MDKLEHYNEILKEFDGLRKSTGYFSLDCKRLEKETGEESLENTLKLIRQPKLLVMPRNTSFAGTISIGVAAVLVSLTSPLIRILQCQKKEDGSHQESAAHTILPSTSLPSAETSSSKKLCPSMQDIFWIRRITRFPQNGIQFLEEALNNRMAIEGRLYNTDIGETPKVHPLKMHNSTNSIASEDTKGTTRTI